MRIIDPDAYITHPVEGMTIIRRLEAAGRVCYKSEKATTDEQACDFVRSIVKRGHEAVIEHANITAKFICDRGVSHEIVRHRIASYCQESTRYCNYGNDKFNSELTFIRPFYWNAGLGEPKHDLYRRWLTAMQHAEDTYLHMIEAGATPQEARSVLPNSLKTELIMTANMREWRHFFKLRTDKAAHPQMIQVASHLLSEFQSKIPVLFDDIVATCITPYGADGGN
jgi:thymidylate synthase (FAD)